MKRHSQDDVGLAFSRLKYDIISLVRYAAGGMKFFLGDGLAAVGLSNGHQDAQASRPCIFKFWVN